MNINRVIYIETDLNRFDYIDSCLKLKGEHFAFYDSAPNVILNDVVYNFVVRSGIIIIAKSASVVCTEIHLQENGKWRVKFEVLEKYLRAYMKNRPDPWALNDNCSYTGKQLRL